MNTVIRAIHARPSSDSPWTVEVGRWATDPVTGRAVEEVERIATMTVPEARRLMDAIGALIGPTD